MLNIMFSSQSPIWYRILTRALGVTFQISTGSFRFINQILRLMYIDICLIILPIYHILIADRLVDRGTFFYPWSFPNKFKFQTPQLYIVFFSQVSSFLPAAINDSPYKHQSTCLSTLTLFWERLQLQSIVYGSDVRLFFFH